MEDIPVRNQSPIRTTSLRNNNLRNLLFRYSSARFCDRVRADDWHAVSQNVKEDFSQTGNETELSSSRNFSSVR